jgi:hypothetical protein
MASLCLFCGNDMADGAGCTDDPVGIGSLLYMPVRWGHETGYRFTEMTDLCGDCGVRRGGVHHHGCDLEQCPACGGQAIFCECPEME